MKNILLVADVVEEVVPDLETVEEEITKTAQWVEDMVPRAIEFVLQVALAFVVIVIGMKVIGWVRKLLRKSLEKQSADTGLAQFLDSLVKYGLYTLLGISILSHFGVQTTSIVAAIGSVGVAIGLALQGSLSNFAGGVIILLLKPFKVGDYIIQGDLEGYVSEIQLFCTSLNTADNRRIIIPNGQLADNSLINAYASEYRRIDVTVGISYQSDIKAAKEVLLKVGAEDADTIKEGERAPIAAVTELADSSVNMLLRVLAPTVDYWAIKFRLTEAVKLALDDAGIEIPFNQLDVHLINS